MLVFKPADNSSNHRILCSLALLKATDSLITYIHTYIHFITTPLYVIYNNNKYTVIKLQWGKKKYIYICYNKKYLHEFIYSHKNLIQSKKSLQDSGLSF